MEQRIDIQLKEYDILENEMNHHREKQSQIFLYSLISAGALFAFAGSTNFTDYLFLSPLMVLIPSTFIVVSLTNANNMISAYIVEFIENNVEGLNYESLKNNLIWPKQPSPFKTYFPVFQAMVFSNSALSILAILISLYYAIGKGDSILLLLAIISIFFVILALQYARGPFEKSHQIEIRKCWQKLKR